MTSLHSVLETAIRHKSCIRINNRLKPANTDGLVYPPTYDKGTHLFRKAWINGESRDSVLLDSVQSQANRVENSILEAYRNGKINYPDIILRVDAKTGEESYSILELSHRTYDAALRFSLINSVAFGQSEIGKAVYGARTDRATALYEHSPITLALGGWDSHGGGGSLVAKLPRLITSEIVGLDAMPVTRASVKFDPMDIRKDAGPLYESKDPDRRFEIEKSKAVGKKQFDPSAIGLGSVPNTEQRGAVITEAVQTSLVSCTAARRLKFENSDGSYSAERNHCGRVAVVALGLYGLLSQMDEGYYLRSGCDLIPIENPKLEIIGRTLNDIDSHEINVDMALDALKTALQKAEDQGLVWRKDTITAEADDRLITLVERSRNAALKDVDGGQ